MLAAKSTSINGEGNGTRMTKIVAIRPRGRINPSLRPPREKRPEVFAVVRPWTADELIECGVFYLRTKTWLWVEFFR
jgi:hypothetical protein